jgi:hypothetical protein
MATLTATEREHQDAIVDACRLLGYRVTHFRPARDRHGRWHTAVQGDPGFPDLVIAGHGHLVMVELKRHPNRPTPDQQAWLTTLAAAGVDARIVWLPDGQQPLIDQLTTWTRR